MAQEKKDWELNPHNYQTNEDGSFILKVDGTPKKKGGRPKGSKSGYNYHSKTKAKIAARKSVAAQEKDVKVLNRRLKYKKQSLEKKK